MPHPYWSYASLAVAFGPTVFGLAALLRPDATMAAAHFPTTTQLETRNTARTVFRVYGSRNLAVSYLLYLIWTTGNQRLMGYSLFAALGMITFDGFAVRGLTGGHEWEHWSFVPVAAAVAAGLLGAFDSLV
jgi:hypothetical protein